MLQNTVFMQKPVTDAVFWSKKGTLHRTEQIDSLQRDHGLFWEYMDKIICILMEKKLAH